MHVTQSDDLTVEHIFAFARAEVAAGDGNLVPVAVERSVRVVKAQSDLGKAQRFSDLCAAEDNVFHL